MKIQLDAWISMLAVRVGRLAGFRYVKIYR